MMMLKGKALDQPLDQHNSLCSRAVCLPVYLVTYCSNQNLILRAICIYACEIDLAKFSQTLTIFQNYVQNLEAINCVFPFEQ